MRWIAATPALLLLAITLVVEVEPKARVTNKILFVVDRSGSMHGDHFSRALAAILAMTGSTDDAQIGVIAFNHEFIRWSGKPEDGVPKGWARIPSTAPLGAQCWLTALGAGGDTLIIPALEAALADDRENMTIVIVSDGLFGRERMDEVLGALRKGQAKRKHRAVVACYGLGERQAVLVELAKAGGGGYVREAPDLPDEEGPVLRGVVPLVPPK